MRKRPATFGSFKTRSEDRPVPAQLQRDKVLRDWKRARRNPKAFSEEYIAWLDRQMDRYRH